MSEPVFSRILSRCLIKSRRLNLKTKREMSLANRIPKKPGSGGAVADRRGAHCLHGKGRSTHLGRDAPVHKECPRGMAPRSDHGEMARQSGCERVSRLRGHTLNNTGRALTVMGAGPRMMNKGRPCPPPLSPSTAPAQLLKEIKEFLMARTLLLP